MKRIASLSGGKDSVAMILKLIEEKWQLDEVITFDTQWEFESVYKNINKIGDICKENNIKFTIIKREIDSWYEMFAKPINTRNGSEKYGYGWCGGCARWNTTFKIQYIKNYLKKNYGTDFEEYIGIAFDEPNRVKDKIYPLVEWKMTEQQALAYCYQKGFDWLEDGVELYSILDRVSCWNCRNKNLKELKGIYLHLPKYWRKLKGLQSRIKEPFKQSGSIGKLEERFKEEEKNKQLELF